MGFDGRGQKYMFCIDPEGKTSLNKGVDGNMGKRKQNPTEAMQFNGTSHPQRLCINNITPDEKLPYLAKLDTLRKD